MMKQTKKRILACLLAVMMIVLCGCHQNPPQEQLYSKLFSHFANYGFACKLQPIEPQRKVPIYKPSAWQSLWLDGEEVLVYFDDSNRADYLSTFVDESVYGPAWCFGLRFVLVYDGENAKVLEALNAIVNE